jgi:hypothetical protein
MNKEQIIDEVYENFIDKTKGLNLNLEINKDIIVVEGPIYHATPRLLSQEEFINKCKTDNEFSETWGLKIEERELSLEERKRIYEIEYTNDIEVENNHWLESKLKTRNIPTKKITLEYNNEKTYYYE